VSEARHNARKRYIQLWPIWAAAGFPLLEIVLEASPIAPNFAFVMLGLPSLWLVWAASALCSAILTILSLRRQDWRKAGISIVLPLVVLWAALNFRTYIRFCNNTGDAVHFYARYPAYAREVSANAQTAGPQLLIFNLGGMSWASRGFVFDESDELLRDPSMQSPGWKVRAMDSELGCGYGAVRMPGPSIYAEHWYIASFAC
jgi:hypothetical protein